MESQEHFLVSGPLVLLALMFGSATSFVVDCYDQRRLLVVEEANPIGTAYLRSQALDEPHRTRLSNLLVEYANNRMFRAPKLNVGKGAQGSRICLPMRY